MNSKRVALVTGSTSGIGLAIAKRLIEDISRIASMLVASNYLTGETILADGGLNLT